MTHDDAHPVLAATRVEEVMSHPIQACAPDLELPEVARILAELGIHCVAVMEEGEDGSVGAFLGVLSDLDLVEAADVGFERKTARQAAVEPPVSVPADASLAVAAREMSANRAHHLVVVEPGSGRPVGLLSTLDIARALGGVVE